MDNFTMLDILLKYLFCHMIGDYVLQVDFIARTKGENWYHLFVHCVLYTLPFYVIGCKWWILALIFISHIVIDALKARYKKINYVTDQIYHYIVLGIAILWSTL